MDEVTIQPRIICQLDFLKRFFEKYREMPYDFSSFRKRTKWMDLYENIKDSNLKVDFDIHHILEILNEELEHFNYQFAECPLFKLLKPFICDGKLTIEEVPSPLSTKTQADNKNLLSIYLVEGNGEDKKTASKATGIYILPVESCLELEEYDKLTIPVKNGERFNWYEVLEKAPIMNSAIIMDRYIVKDKECAKNNLFPIIDALVPSSLTVPFNLTVIASELYTDPKSLYDLIIEHLKISKPGVKIKLAIYRGKTAEYHDRVVLSNNFFMTCPKGFDICNKSNCAQINGFTTISLSNIGICKDSNEKTIWRGYMELANQIGKGSKPYGDPNNRLFTSKS